MIAFPMIDSLNRYHRISLLEIVVWGFWRAISLLDENSFLVELYKRKKFWESPTPIPFEGSISTEAD